MKILLIEDDKDLCSSLSYRLEKENFTVDVCHDGEEGLYYIKENLHDLIILDRMLPLLDGTQVLKEARRSGIGTPVIFLTALGTLNDKVTGLDCGADDYMVKPFAFEELMARIRSLLRRPGNWNGTAALTLGDLSYDPDSHMLSSGKKHCTLSRREGDLMEFFLRNPGQILSRELLLNRVWGMDTDVEDGNLDNYIHFLRRRLKTLGTELSLKTVRGVGYLMERP